MKKLAILITFAATAAYAATWTGTISDEHCAAKHADASEKSIACVEKCVKGGAAPVFITSDGKVLKIANADAVKEHLGHKVDLTGDLSGDTITVASVKMP
jgi:hypothetical protein